MKRSKKSSFQSQPKPNPTQLIKTSTNPISQTPSKSKSKPKPSSLPGKSLSHYKKTFQKLHQATNHN